MTYDQWWANPNPDLDLNRDLTTFAKSSGFFPVELFWYGGFEFGFELFSKWWILILI